MVTINGRVHCIPPKDQSAEVREALRKADLNGSLEAGVIALKGRCNRLSKAAAELDALKERCGLHTCAGDETDEGCHACMSGKPDVFTLLDRLYRIASDTPAHRLLYAAGFRVAWDTGRHTLPDSRGAEYGCYTARALKPVAPDSAPHVAVYKRDVVDCVLWHAVMTADSFTEWAKDHT